MLSVGTASTFGCYSPTTVKQNGSAGAEPKNAVEEENEEQIQLMTGGKTGSRSPAGTAIMSVRTPRAGVLGLHISPLPANSDSDLRKPGWAIAINCCARSETDRPRSSAMPYSVTTVSASLRAVVTIPPLKLGNDARNSTVACGRLHDNDAATAWRLEATAHEIAVPANHPDVAMSCDLRVHLAREIDFKGGVDADQPWDAGVNEDVMRVAG